MGSGWHSVTRFIGVQCSVLIVIMFSKASGFRFITRRSQASVRSDSNIPFRFVALSPGPGSPGNAHFAVSCY